MGRISQKEIIQKFFLNKDLVKANLTKVGFDQESDAREKFLRISNLIRIYCKNAKITPNLIKEIKKRLSELEQSEEKINVVEVSCLDT